MKRQEQRRGRSRQNRKVSSITSVWRCLTWLTRSTSRSWLAISHSPSSSTSSTALKLFARSPVNLSTAARYSSTKSSIKNVEFQRVRTSRGIVRSGKPSSRKTRYHSGKRIVDELITENASLRIWDALNNWCVSKYDALTLANTIFTGRRSSTVWVRA